MKKWLSVNQKIARLLFWHHFIVLVAPTFFFLLKGFDFEEVALASLIPLEGTVVFWFFYAFDLDLAPPNCLGPRYRYMWLYFWVMLLAMTVKALAPNWLNFPFMMVVLAATEILFCRYIWKFYKGIGCIESTKIEGAKAIED